MLFKKYVVVKQFDSRDCGVACLATVAKSYGKKVNITRLREVAGTDKNGTTAYGLIEAAREIGFIAKGITTDDYMDIVGDFPKPAIAHVIIDKKLKHFVVIHEVNKIKNEVIVADPAKGIVKYKFNEFFDIWTGTVILLTPSIKFEKQSENTGSIKRFIYLIKPQKRLLIDIFLISIFITIFGIAGSFYYKFLMDDVVITGLISELNIISIGVVVLTLFNAIFNFLRSHIMVYLSARIDVPLLLGYYNHVMNLPLKFFTDRRVGEIFSRFSDAIKIREAIASASITIMIDTFMCIIGGIILFYQSSKLFSITLIPVLFYIILVFSFKKSIEKNNMRVMENNSELTSYMLESFNGIETIKSYNAEDRVMEKNEKIFMKYLRSIMKFSFITNAQVGLKTSVKTVFAVVILWCGMYLYLKGSISIGEILSFNALLVYFLEPLERIINLQPQIQMALVASERLGQILDLELEKDDEINKISNISLKGDIELKNINFRYGKRELVLNNVNISIKQGEKIALVGESGSGKSTILKLLMGFYKIEKGEILINNYNLNDISMSLLRDKISYISQDTFFFTGSIRDNLSIANKRCTYEEIIDSCRKAHIDSYIERLEQRYDTYIEENGANLSGGQKQRLSIARAILKKPEILIMDEATSNLDSITEKSIEYTLSEFSKNMTTIIIAHRLNTIMNCDKIYVLRNGEVVEEGNHNKLMSLKGEYYRMWHGQALDK